MPRGVESPLLLPDVVTTHKHLRLESRVDDCGDAQLFVVALFQLGLYTVDILKLKMSKSKAIFATKINQNQSFIH